MTAQPSGRNRRFTAWSLAAFTALLALAGCGGPGKDAPRVWYDEAGRRQLPDHYQLPRYPGDPDNTDEYLAGGAYERGQRGYVDGYGYNDPRAVGRMEDEAYRRHDPNARPGDNYQGRDYGEDADYRAERNYETGRYGYERRGSDGPPAGRPVW